MKGLLLVMLSLFPVVALAATEIRTVSAEATGIDREQAVYNALGEAVRQVRGAQISASRQVRSALARVSQRTNDGRESSTTVSSAQKSETRVASSGLISGYRILSVTNTGDGSGKLARLEVDVPVYKAPGSSAQDNRWRMAVYPVETARGSYTVDRTLLSAEEVSRRFTHSISDALTQSRRFAVLARDSEGAIFDERHRMAGKDVPVSEKAMLGNTLGAEYLVVTRVSDLSLGSRQQVSTLTGEKSTIATGAAVLEIRVVIPATGGIVWSQTLNTTSTALGLKLDGTSHSVQKIFDRIGREVALRVIDAVWPPLVEKQQGGELVINMGGNLMAVGDTWEVFKLGDAVRNSHTGSGLGREEQRIATVQITRSTPKMAYAKVVDGNVEGSGHVLRRGAHSSSSESAAEKVRGTRKRTCLPIDPC
ncbi:CsgG/HfaB family protein [uncultured Marinobacter sp.]|uniref:CsgG/HfaB family protein n=1 Tax=uncultured Marinobacter sp. TaxID=187379 RepID=UPI0030DC1CC8|tara:strand:- start:2251 stop:3516 length:1266 start_codon:yes stop_codon:yes gene_type:complete